MNTSLVAIQRNKTKLTTATDIMERAHFSKITAEQAIAELRAAGYLNQANALQANVDALNERLKRNLVERVREGTFSVAQAIRNATVSGIADDDLRPRLNIHNLSAAEIARRAAAVREQHIAA
ncbi:MAG: hypothetical protein ACREGR_01960 [Minisyncoccia bacterium]